MSAEEGEEAVAAAHLFDGGSHRHPQLPGGDHDHAPDPCHGRSLRYAGDRRRPVAAVVVEATVIAVAAGAVGPAATAAAPRGAIEAAAHRCAIEAEAPHRGDGVGAAAGAAAHHRAAAAAAGRHGTGTGVTATDNRRRHHGGGKRLSYTR